MNAIYLGDIYSKDDLVKILSNFNQTISYVVLMIRRWEDNSCPDCGAPMKIVGGYLQKCSKKPKEHLLCDNEFYLKKIKEMLERNALYKTRK